MPSSLQEARLVALRALCVGALLTRHELELRVKSLSEYPISEEDLRTLLEKRQAANDRLWRWLAQEKLLQHLTSAERNLLEKPLGSWSARALTMTSWRAETLGMLMWALRLVETIPTYDTPFESDELLAPLDIFGQTIDLLWMAQLRPTDQLYRMRDTAEMWAWRARAAELQLMGIRPTEGVDFRDVIRTTAEQAYADGTLPAPIDGDFPVFGKSFATVSNDEFELVRGIASERYQIMAWLTEQTVEWDSLPVDL